MNCFDSFVLVLQCSQEHAGEEMFYVLPNHAGGGLLALDTLLTGMGGNAGLPPGTIQDDSFDAYAAYVDSSPVHVIRLLHANPNAQKAMRSAANQMRQDHVAVSVYRVVHKDMASMQIQISGKTFRTPDAIKVIG